ncbi:hypothetical protein CAPTEDRAFT_34319, partial [Capitella teleta]
PPDPSCCQRFRYAFLCPPHGTVAQGLTLVLCLLLAWGLLWGITGAQALPGGNLFSIFIVVVCASVGGRLVQIIHLPPLLGMLIVGFALRNIPVINVAKDIDPMWSGALRNTALAVILTRAGLGLDPVALRKLSRGVFLLAFSPCIAETVVEAIAAHFILGFPWLWGVMLGFVLAAVSPAVVVPSMLSLHEQGYGVIKGIPTLVIAAASVDDVLAISGFGVALGIAFSKGDLVWTIFKGPLEAVLGIVYGFLLGFLGWYFPHSQHGSRNLFRFLFLFAAGLFSIFVSLRAELSGAGALGALTTAFVVAVKWRGEMEAHTTMPVSEAFAVLWVVFQPVLFSLIGAEVSIEALQPKTVGLGLAVLGLGLSLRLVVSFLAVFGLNFNWKEKFFIPLAWLPKATVQAAIGSYALDTARAFGSDPEDIKLGTQVVLTIAVLSIVITAPLGAAAIALSAPRLLHK